MAEVNIMRKPTEEELKNFTPVGFETLEKKFRKQRIDIEQEYVKNHEPYCARCASLDFTDTWEDKKKEISRAMSGGQNQGDQTKITFNFPDLKKYGEKDRFTLKSKSPIIRDVIVDGVNVPKLMGHYHEYVCNKRGCGHSVQVPLVGFDLSTSETPAEKTKTNEKSE